MLSFVAQESHTGTASEVQSQLSILKLYIVEAVSSGGAFLLADVLHEAVGDGSLSADVSSASLSSVLGDVVDSKATKALLVNNKTFLFLKRHCYKFFTFIYKVILLTADKFYLAFILNGRRAEFLSFFSLKWVQHFALAFRHFYSFPGLSSARLKACREET